MDKASDGISAFGFIITNAMSADYSSLCFNHFRKAASENAFQNIEIGFFREAYQRKGSQWTSTHGVNIVESIGGGNLAKSVGVIDNGGEEINGLDQRGSGADLIDPGVV